MIFLPTIYEHAATLIGKTPSQTAQSAELLAQGQLMAHHLYGHKLISVGLDIYNTEAEALGAQMIYYEDDNLPAVKDIVFPNRAAFERRVLPNPETSGRMPVMLKTADLIAAQVAKDVVVSGSVTGPFTLAAILRGFEEFTMDLIDDIDFAIEQLEFAAQISSEYAGAFMRRGHAAALNDSWIAPPLLSPRLYREHVFPLHKRIIGELLQKWGRPVSLICGGNVSAIASEMARTGTTLLMADWNSDRKLMAKLCAEHDITLRASVEPSLLERGDKDEMKRCAEVIARDCGGYPRTVVGCGIVTFATPPESVLAFRDIVAAL